MLYLIGVIITFFLAFILGSKNNKTIPDRILFVWLLFLGIHLYLFYLLFTNQIYQYPNLLGISIPLPLMHGPFLFLYTASLTNQIKNFKIQFLHFLPCILSYLFLIKFFNLNSEEKVQIYQHDGQGYETFMSIHIGIVILSGIVYFVGSLILLRKHKLNILNEFSYTENINLFWLQYLIYGIGVIWIIVILGEDKVIFLFVTLFVIALGYFGIKQNGIFTKLGIVNEEILELGESIKTTTLTQELKEVDSIDQNIKPIKYEKSGLSEEMALEIHNSLTVQMDELKLYTNPDITLVELSQVLKVPSNYLSQVINTYENKNFYDYINTKRINLFLDLIKKDESKKYTILSIAFDCGFNSKSSFNKYFKKTTDLTPSEYIKSLQ
tara:strand:- start:3339 stop:4481 length:1143 start_codon:yes stop_codon:yes gene_type:complete